MKKITLFSILPLLGIGQLAAQDYEYVPFVREGVKWVYYYENPVYGMDYQQGYIPGGRYFYSMEMKGDTVINGKSYKPVHVSGIDLNQEMVPVYLREENKVVYGIIPDERRYWECPVGIGTSVDNGRFCNDKIEAGVEFKLYDFGDPANFYENEVECTFIKPKYNQADTVQVGNRPSLRHSVSFGYDEGYFIEGLGYVGNSVGPVVGTPLDYFYPVSTGMTQVAYRLSHVIEDGSVVYKTSSYMEPMPGYYEYVPLVREGVKWVYYYDNPFDREVLGMDEGIQYYSFEVKGEVQIGDKCYKPVVLSHYVDGGKVVEDFVPVYLREQDKIVYAICPDGILHPECPVGRHGQINGSSPLTITDEEFVLYDFNDANSFIIEDFIWGGGLLYVGNRKVKSYQCYEDDMVIETIGYDGPHGMPLFFFSNNGGKHVDYRLSHVLEDGEIIYKGQYYNPDTHVGIDEVVVDRAVRPVDGNYYNLMGQPMGKDVPTVPGIYIHQGKKIIVR